MRATEINYLILLLYQIFLRFSARYQKRSSLNSKAEKAQFLPHLSCTAHLKKSSTYYKNISTFIEIRVGFQNVLHFSSKYSFWTFVSSFLAASTSEVQHHGSFGFSFRINLLSAKYWEVLFNVFTVAVIIAPGRIILRELTSSLWNNLFFLKHLTVSLTAVVPNKYSDICFYRIIYACIIRGINVTKACCFLSRWVTQSIPIKFLQFQRHLSNSSHTSFDSRQKCQKNN